MDRLIRLPRAFYVDHEERGLPTPFAHRSTRRHVWISRFDAATQELRDDAEFYADSNGPDQCPPGLVASAKATLKALDDR